MVPQPTVTTPPGPPRQVQWTDLHHRLLRAVDQDRLRHDGDTVTIYGLPLAADAYLGVARLVVAGLVGQSLALTPYGSGVLARWDTEHPETGGAA